MTCAQVQDLAAEFALGLLDGKERAAVLDHLAGCDDCRRAVAAMAAAADGLLLAAPETEPPAGFEVRALARMGAADRPTRRRARLVALLAGTLGVGVALGALLPGNLPQGREPVRAARLVAATAAVAGEIYTYAGEPPWLFMTVRGAPDGTYTCRVRTRTGEQLDIGRLEVRGGVGAWGRVLTVDPDHIVGVELVDAEGRPVLASGR